MTPEQLAKPLKVARRIQETGDAVSLVLEIPQELKSQYRYQAGQFVTFFMNIDGQAINRSYSLSSSPLVDSEFKITVKKVQGGRGSTFLCERVNEGDTLLTTPPAGHFFKPAPEGTHYVLFAAGSGITPVFSIMKTVLTASPLNRVTLVYCNRQEDSVIYKNELENWSKQKASQLQLIHVFSQPQGSWNGYTGRLQKNQITEILQKPTAKSPSEFYLCGPSEFMATVRTSLMDLGFSKGSIHEEDFAIGLQAKPSLSLKEDWIVIGEASPAERPEKIIATINNETIEVEAKEGQSVLESLLEAGAQPPYSCMDGTCMACLAKVIEGGVYQETAGILNEDNFAHRETLTCQAKPLSRIVKLSYDNL